MNKLKKILNKIPKNHTTVIHSVKTIEKLRKEDNELNINIDNLKNKILYNKENEI